MRRRFFVDRFENQHAVMRGEAAHHLGRVLRAQPGQLYELSDGSNAWVARIESVARDRVDFALIEPLPAFGPTLETTLFLSVVKFDAFEWALEKATELGVNRIVPLAAARSEKGLLAAAAKRARRWEKIVFESSQQSRRVRLPVIEPVKKLAPAFESETAGLRVLLSERAEARPLREIFRDSAPHSVALAVGPEGGWTDQELATARQAGFREASLGPLILRAETAVTAALAAANYALDA